MQEGSLNGITITNCDVDVECEIEPISPREVLRRCREGRGVSAPAMALYAVGNAKGKPVKIAPSFVQRQLDEWHAVVQAAEQIIIVGVCVNSNDDHLWGALAACGGTVYYFGVNEQDEASFAEWRGRAGIGARGKFERGFFGDSIEAIHALVRS